MTGAVMDAQLTLLLEIQDLTAKVGELEAKEGLGTLEANQFGMDVEGATEALRAKLEELEGALPEPLRRRYERISGHINRVVVPVISGICYGCFVSVPAEQAGADDANAVLRTCEHCGRFLYFLS